MIQSSVNTMTERVIVLLLLREWESMAENFLKLKNNEVHSRVVLPKNILYFVSENAPSALKTKK